MGSITVRQPRIHQKKHIPVRLVYINNDQNDGFYYVLLTLQYFGTKNIVVEGEAYLLLSS